MIIREERRTSSTLKEEVSILRVSLKKMQEDNLLLTDYVEQLEVDLRNKEEENIEKMLKLKEDNQSLLIKNEKYMQERDNLEASNNIINKEM